jgi:hypothetical protein
LIQPFGVGIASPLKAHFKGELIAQIDCIIKADPAKSKQSFIFREIIVGSFIDA